MNDLEKTLDTMRYLREMLEEVRADVKMLRVEVVTLKNELDKYKAQGKYMTTAEACAILRIGRTTMHERLTSGEYPWAVKRHGKWLFPADKLRLHADGLA